MGRQLFEKEGLYLHKRPWKEREKKNLQKERQKEREEGVLEEWTTLAKPLRDKSCGEERVLWAGIWPGVYSKQMENNRLQINWWHGNDSSVKSHGGEEKGDKRE